MKMELEGGSELCTSLNDVCHLLKDHHKLVLVIEMLN